MSVNEWSDLKQVIVGHAHHAKIPTIDKSLRVVNYADTDDITSIKTGDYPSLVVSQANEDLDIFANFLSSEGVKVLRPKINNCNYYNYCPRDSVLVHGDLAIATPMPIKARKNEYTSFQHHLKSIIHMECSHLDSLYNIACVGNPETLAITEEVPAFDAANVIRSNNDLLYLVSNSGNKAGARVLQEMLGNDVRVRTLEGVYSYMHIDSTIAFLREGLMLLNPSRIKDVSVLPEPFCNWDYIWCPEPADIGFYDNYCNASKWINMNLFSINPNLVVIEENQHSLRKELEKKNIECAMLPMRHQRTLGGGFHCVTLDTSRSLT